VDPQERRLTRSSGLYIASIDGEELADLMYEHGIGVTPTANYAVKRVDSDYFGEE
jgi:restriction system protein